MKKNIVLLISLLITMSILLFGSDSINRDDKVVLHLILSDGFVPNEKICINHVDNHGNSNTVFSGELVRMNTQDENSFKILLEKNKYNEVSIMCTQRDQKTKHGFILGRNLYLDVSIDLKNEFLFVCADSLGYSD